MSTLDIKKIRRNYLIFSLFLIIFASIYEYFSHEVYSMYMIFSFAIPLILGFTISFIKKNLLNTFYNLGIVTLTIGSVFRGVLEIYGSTNRLLYVYIVVGLLLIVIGIIKCFKNNRG